MKAVFVPAENTSCVHCSRLTAFCDLFYVRLCLFLSIYKDIKNVKEL